MPKRRMFRRWAAAGCAAAALSIESMAHSQDAQVATQPSNATLPADHITKVEAERAFAEAMFVCLGSRLAGQMIKDAPNDAQAPYATATEGDRAWTGVQLRSDEPVWVSRRLGHLLLIVEPSRDRCEVHGTQFPVDASFQLVRDAIKQNLAGIFAAVQLSRGVSPIAYQYEGVADGSRFVVHMEGAEPGHIESPEPGKPGLDLPTSILFGAVIRQAATDSPAFR